MNLRAIFILTVFTILCVGNFLRADAQTRNTDMNTDPAAGVPRELARERAQQLGNIRYALSVEISPGAAMLKGTEEIRVTLRDDGDVPALLALDWRVAAPKENEARARVWNIKANGRGIADAREANDHLLIPGKYLVKGENRISLNFESPISTSGSAVTRYLDREDKSEYIYTLFVPSDASTVFPCFDQPDLKARFTLNVTAPARWKVITNTLAEEDGILVVNKPGQERYVYIPFEQTQPISTYLFAFAAGDFAVFRDTVSLTYTRLFVRRSKEAQARKELAEVFRLHREGLKFLAEYFDYPFPFPKYDVVIVPEFAYGGMEYAGCTFLREESILFPSDPTANDLLARAEVIFHEAAHQWFGDLVTMRWFDDLWLKEGFATFMAYKAMERIMPERNAWKAFYQRTKPAAYLTDVTKGTTPIFQEIPNLSAAKSAYGNIVYRKAPSMLRQAEFFLEPDKFQKAVRMFLKEHAYANAEWADLVSDFERASGKKLDVWAAAWVKRRGMADVRVSWSANAKTNRIERFTLRQTDVLNEGGAWPMRVKVLLAYDDAPPVILTVAMNGERETIVREAINRQRPAYVFANYEDYGYGRFLLDDASRPYVLNNLGNVHDEFLRALLWGSLWDSVREAELAPSAYINLAIKLVAQEQDEVTVQSILGRASTAFNRYLSDKQMRDVAAPLEKMIAERMMNAATPGLRITYFRAFQSIATTDGARGELKRILIGEEKIPGMTLRTRDRFDLVTTLLSRDDPDAPALLDKLKETETTDDARRYAFAAAAARDDSGVKQKYFDSYVHDAKLAESWIEASLNPFNTTRQSDLTLPYLEPALRQLPVLKRTRKIFFVNGWLAAFIGGQRDKSALDVVRKFLQEQTLDRDLRLKVLENVDGLERTVKIRDRYAREG
ncbi:MAG: M1 family metallopeptidase [Pyrinomonadaceae bacterium]